MKMWWKNSKKSFSRVFATVGVTSMALGLAACGTASGSSSDMSNPSANDMSTPMPGVTGTPMPEATGTPTQGQTIVDLAVSNPDLTTLAMAVQTAGLADTLAGEGPFTVFAPTDEAFAALPQGTLDSLTEETLRDVLLYHVVEGEVTAEQVVELDSAMTLQGQFVDIRVEDGNVYVNDAQVVITDVQASNGVVHVIDTVLMP